MKSIEVVAAIIKDKDKILATRRGYGEFINMWEFPGGKVEPGETKEEALHREIQEELKVSISIDKYLKTIEYDYPNFHLVLHSYLCSISEGTIQLMEHNAAKWVTKSEIDSLEWLPADDEIIRLLKETI